MNKYVRSNPAFFRLIKRAMAAIVLLVVVIALLLPAPLLAPADLSRVPNPSRAAWYLIWMQELVSYTKYAVYPILFGAGVLAALPWFPGNLPAHQAQWWPRDQRLVNWLATLAFIVILLLTIVALYFRGENWSFGWFF
ncbi:MAG: cytochrome B6 [Desulfobacteraceae bacterium 4572_35.1]|nr:MAG: cytochrome B6 [Desulfobacteraceae bacterium 4572_35.1]